MGDSKVIIEDLLCGFNFKLLQECMTLLKHLELKAIPLSQFKKYMQIYVIDSDKLSAILKQQKQERAVEQQKFDAHTPKCPNCEMLLKVRESISDEYETDFVCKCGYVYHTDISIVDYTELIKSKANNTEPDFSIEELRATKNSRLQRREICRTCDQLTPNKTCKACGCRMKHRTYYKILNCPKKYW